LIVRKPTNRERNLTLKTLNRILTNIAVTHLNIPTLRIRRSDHLDFHDVSVWAVRSALKAAFAAGCSTETARLNSRDIHELLAQRRQVAVVWGVEDVQGVRPDLGDDQAWKVLQQCRGVHDCGLGFNWLLIETVADDLFPPPNDA
jgi:hypothetical protein